MDMRFKNIISSRSLLLTVPIFLATFGMYFNSKPYTYIVRGESIVLCDTGKAYPAAPNNINDVSGLRGYIENGYTDMQIQAEDLKARKLCSFGVINDFVPFRNIPDKRNYTVKPGMVDLMPETFEDPGVILSNK